MSLVAAHGFSRVLTLVLAMTMATLPFMSALPPWLTLGIIMLAAWRVQAEYRGFVFIPPMSFRLLLALGVAGLLLLTNELGFGLAAATPLFVGFLWIKLLELKARRDYLLACFLCYFLVAVMLFDHSSLTYSFYAIATIAAITTALVGYHMDARARQVIGLGLRLCVSGLPLAIIIFMLFPRLQMNIPNMGNATSGFTDELTPGDVARLALSEEPVMRVEFPNNDMPSADQLYWRGLVLSQTNGEKWSVSKDVFVYQDRPVPSDPQLPAIVQNISLEPMNQRWLFALDVAEVAPERTRLAVNRALVRRQPPTQTLRYQVTSRVGDMATDLDDVSSRIPERVDIRVRQLAQTWRDQATRAEDIIDQGVAYFRQQGFTYSLNPGIMADDSVVDFLFNKRAGFCAHYATSFSLLMRCAGLPARVIVGFHRGDLNPVGGFLLLRRDHAHAWSEVRINGRWKRVDPTVGLPLAPGETQPAALRNATSNTLSSSERKPWWMPGLLETPYRTVAQYWQYAEARWESSVMGFDGAAQSSWLRALGITEFVPAVLFISVTTVVGLVVVVMLWWRRRERVAASSDPLLIWYNSFCTHLAAVGVERAPAEGPLDFTLRAAQALPQHAGLITQLGQEYIALRYGVTPLTPATRARLFSAIRRLPKRPATPASAAATSS
jgi:transglutaminase-like putative cysteine protease